MAANMDRFSLPLEYCARVTFRIKGHNNYYLLPISKHSIDKTLKKKSQCIETTLGREISLSFSQSLSHTIFLFHKVISLLTFHHFSSTVDWLGLSSGLYISLII